MFTKTLDRSFTTLALAGVCAGGLAFTGEANADAGGDLMFYVNPSDSTELKVGRYDFDGGTGAVLESETEPVIIAEMEPSWEFSPNPGTDEPGLTTDGALQSGPTPDPDGQSPSFPFPADTALIATANVLPVLGVDLAYWDGDGAVSFGATPQSIIVESPFSPGPLEEEFVFDGDGVAPSGQMAPWQSLGDGTNHDHFEFLSPLDNASTTPGIYLFSLTFEAGGAVSEPLYFLLGYADGVELTDVQLDSALELAEGYVENVIIPEPASAMLLAAAGGLALIRRR
ncbi:MAG: PEP-CTERM sorting domain-containing protein [Planctomycetota bacterium]